MSHRLTTAPDRVFSLPQENVIRNDHLPCLVLRIASPSMRKGFVEEGGMTQTEPHDAGRIIMVTGGARSGKSALAEGLAARHNVSRGQMIYIATAQALDDEMAGRIALHQKRRDQGWRTVEEPLDLAGALAKTDGQGVRLVDCLTLWLANAQGQADIAQLCRQLSDQRSPVIVVTNELGLGIVPADPLTRRFRDAHGWMNQSIAAISHEVWLAVSGIPLRLKPSEHLP